MFPGIFNNSRWRLPSRIRSEGFAIVHYISEMSGHIIVRRWRAPPNGTGFQPQIPAQILENYHPCDTNLCMELLETHWSDSKILLICSHKIPSGWQSRISDTSSDCGWPIRFSLWHQEMKSNVTCDTNLCTELPETHWTASKILLIWSHTIPSDCKIWISDRSDAFGRSNERSLWRKSKKNPCWF